MKLAVTGTWLIWNQGSAADVNKQWGSSAAITDSQIFFVGNNLVLNLPDLSPENSLGTSHGPHIDATRASGPLLPV